MKSTLLSQNPISFALIFETGDEVVSHLTRFASENNLNGSHFTAIGAFSEVTLGYFEWGRKDYKRIPVKEQVEVLSLVGNIVRHDGGHKIHAHVVLGRSDGTAAGGHVMEARVRPTLEVVITETPTHLVRRMDEETGLALIDLEGGNQDAGTP